LRRFLIKISIEEFWDERVLTSSSASLTARSEEIAGAISMTSGFEAAPSRAACHSETSFPDALSSLRIPTFWADVYAAKNLDSASLVASFPFGLARISMESGFAAFSICPRIFAAEK
jgi:hypothetical protein